MADMRRRVSFSAATGAAFGGASPMGDSEAGAGFMAALKMVEEEHISQVSALKSEVHQLRIKLRAARTHASRMDSDNLTRSPSGPRATLSEPLSVPASEHHLIRGESKDMPYIDAPPAVKCGSAPPSPVPIRSSSRRFISTFAAREMGHSKESTGKAADEKSESSGGDDAYEGPAFRTLETIMGQLGMRPMSSNASSNHKRLQWEKLLCVLDSTIGFAIVLNTLLLGISADLQPTWTGWVVIDASFAVLFLAEIGIKLRRFGLTDFFWLTENWLWNLFEFGLVCLACMESLLAIIATAQGRRDYHDSPLMLVFRILRLCRVLRVFRVVRFEIFAELKLMIRGTLGGLRTLLWSTVLICVPVYAVSLVMRETVGKIEEPGNGADSFDVAEYFGSVPSSIFSVFRCLVIGDCSDRSGRPIFVHIVDNYGWGYALVYCGMAVFMSLGLFNVIVAIFVENVVAAARSKSRRERKERLRNKSFFAKKMAALLKIVCEVYDDNQIGDDESQPVKGTVSLQDVFERATWMEITPDLFEIMRYDMRVQKIFDDLDLADEDQFNLFQTLDADGSGAIDLEELCSGISKLRGDACRSDIISINFMIAGVRTELRAIMSRFLKRLYKQEELLSDLRKLQEPLSEIC